MRPPLVRHSSRIKLFTRNRNRNTFHPLQPIHPSSEKILGRKRKKIAVIFVVHRNESFEHPSRQDPRMDPPEETSPKIDFDRIIQREKISIFAQSLEKRWFASWFFETGGAKRGAGEEGRRGGCGIDPLAQNIPSRRPTFFRDETRRDAR